MSSKEALIAKAQVYLRKKFEGSDISGGLDIAGELERRSLFTYARRIRHRIYQIDPSNVKNVRKLAVATYKDDDLPNDLKYDAAANLLYKYYSKDPEKIRHWEAAGILGSIFKKLWRIDNQIKYLFQSVEYYKHGYALWIDARKALKDNKLTYKDVAEKNPKLHDALDKEQLENLNDNGYNGINLAFTYNLLQKYFEDNADGVRSLIAEQFEKATIEVRETLLAFCKEKEGTVSADEKYWFYATWAEVLLGLKRPQEALAILDVEDAEQWKLDSSGRQMTELVGLVYKDWNSGPEETEDREDALSEEDRNALSAFFTKLLGGEPRYDQNEKVGLALSGGGFRASIFHIGVLARLAEADLLKHVEVISCVSGGSIIGAYYYLKLKKLLEEKPDEKITREDYIAIVRDIEITFLEGVGTNLRLRVFSNLWQNVILGVKDSFTRTARLADLYESELFGPLLHKSGGDKHIYMDDLIIRPFDQPDFSIRRDNATRLNKAPMLVLNATSLNTGHCWQFTASWMGEPPGYINNELDARPTYRRMYYSEAPEKFRHVRLATAVGASSCVPGLFAPVTFEGLYEPGRTLRLVDGGVFDNQGVNTLLEQECNSLIISDACGQMVAQDQPDDWAFQVAGRTNAILQERLRDYVFFDLKARQTSGLVRGYLLMHLTKGLPSKVIDWYPCDDKYEFILDETDEQNDLTPYEIRKTVQACLAKVRTDLDSFHQTEAFALMYAGYKMTNYELAKGKASQFTHLEPANSSGWQFERISVSHNEPEKNLRLIKTLDASETLFGKLFTLSPVFKWSFYASVAALAVLVLWLIGIDLNALVAGIMNNKLPLGVALLLLLDLYFLRRKALSAYLLRFVVGIPVMVVLLWPIFWLSKAAFNRYYLYLGRVINK